MTESPTGWIATSLGAIGHYWNGRGFKKSEWRPAGQGRPIIRIQDLTGSNDRPNYFEGEVDERNVARPGDLLVSWAATLGVYEWTGPEAVINQHIFKVESLVDRGFHRYLIEHVLDDLRRRAHGTGMVHITRKVFDETPVLLPPLQEQERIVAAIEEQFSRLDASDAALRSAAQRLRTLPDRVIDQATVNWPTKRLGDLLRQPLRNGHSAKRAPTGNIPVFTLTAVTARDFSERNVKLTAADPRRVEGLWVEPGDILIERSNTPELVGTAALYNGPARRAIFPDLLIRVRVGEAISPAYAEFALRSTRLRRYFQQRAKGIAGSMPKIDQSTILDAEIPFPPVDEQARIVEDLERELMMMDVMSDAIVRALVRSGQLRRSILSEAFSGRLVRQDSNDERPSELVARINAARSTAAKPRSRQRA